VKDDNVMRPAVVQADLEINDTVQLKGMIGAAGAPWIKVYILKNGTKRDSYDVHIPGIGIYADTAIELLRRPGTHRPISDYQAGDSVEMRDIWDFGEDDKLWISMKVIRRGKRPNTYDLGFTADKTAMQSCPQELLRMADGREIKTVEKIYYPGEIVEAKDVLGIMAANATTKALFKIVKVGALDGLFDIQGKHVGIIKDVPAVLLKKVTAEDLQSVVDDAIEVGDFLQCLGVDKPGSNVLCKVDSVGDRPGTFNVRLANYWGVFPNIPSSRLYKKPMNLTDFSDDKDAPEDLDREMTVGDVVDVYDQAYPGEGWRQGTIIDKGNWKNTFEVKLKGKRAAADLLLKNVPLEKLRFTQLEDDRPATTTQSPALLEPLSVGDIVRYRGPGVDANNVSTWVACKIIAEGNVPNTFVLGLEDGNIVSNVAVAYLVRDMRFATTTQAPEELNTYSTYAFVSPTITTLRELIKRQAVALYKEITGDPKALVEKQYRGKFLGDGSVTYENGEMAEVQLSQGETKGQWQPCLITGLGKIANSYNVIPSAGPWSGVMFPVVGAQLLRKIPKANDLEAARYKKESPCNEDDRERMARNIKSEGLFSNAPKECGEAVGTKAIDEDAAGKCVQKKFNISAQCVQCPMAFARDMFSGELLRQNCAEKCMPVPKACQSSTLDPRSCVTKLAECMPCGKIPLVNLLKCMGVADSTTASRLDQLSRALTSGDVLVPGQLESIFTNAWVASHLELLGPLMTGGFTAAAAEDATAEGERKVVALTFQPGEKAEYQIQNGPLTGTWVDCDIRGKGKSPETYNVRIVDGPRVKALGDVSVLILRKRKFNPHRSLTAEQLAEDPL